MIQTEHSINVIKIVIIFLLIHIKKPPTHFLEYESFLSSLFTLW